MPYLEIAVTQRCTLNCKHCANLIHLYEHPEDVPIGQLLEDIDRLMSCVDKIHTLKILGGEPLIYSPLPRLMERLISDPKIGTITIVTNGTILPKADVMPHLASDKVSVEISPYGDILAKNARQMRALFEREGIRHHDAKLDAWRNFGGFDARGRTKAENEKHFAACFRCTTLIDGNVYCCPRAGSGAILGLVPKIPGEFVAIRRKDSADITAGLRDFSILKSISTCDYCDPDGPEIPMAEQTSRKTAEAGASE